MSTIRVRPEITNDHLAYVHEHLRAALPEGSEIRCVLVRVSASRESRKIAVLGVVNGEIENLSWYIHASRLFNRWPLYEVDGTFCLKVDGAGLDVGADVAYWLSRTLYDDAYLIKNRWI